MNKHLAQVKAYAAQNERARRSAGPRSWGFVLIAIFVVFLGQGIGSAQTAGKGHTAGTTAGGAANGGHDSAPVTEDDETPWSLILVNEQFPLPTDFSVVLANVTGGRVDSRIEETLLSMIADAKADGVSLRICSSYRSVSYQKRLYEAQQTKAGIPVYDYVQPPGASEHHTGLAIDLLTAGVSSLTPAFAKTAAYQWLCEHADQYGFIERYPQGKQGITGIEWEPWHFRYVGAASAQYIKAFGLCLEEYAAEHLPAYANALPKEGMPVGPID